MRNGVVIRFSSSVSFILCCLSGLCCFILIFIFTFFFFFDLSWMRNSGCDFFPLVLFLYLVLSFLILSLFFIFLQFYVCKIGPGYDFLILRFFFFILLYLSCLLSFFICPVFFFYLSFWSSMNAKWDRDLVFLFSISLSNFIFHIFSIFLYLYFFLFFIFFFDLPWMPIGTVSWLSCSSLIFILLYLSRFLYLSLSIALVNFLKVSWKDNVFLLVWELAKIKVRFG